MRLAAATQELAAKKHQASGRWGESVRALMFATDAHLNDGNYEAAERCARELAVAAERWSDALLKQAESQRSN